MQLTLDVFEGPLDLLLYLIKKDDLEISRVSIARVAEQYLEYLAELRELDIDVASEFLLMAAELAHIKSRTLLPKQTDDEALEEQDDANRLVEQLRRYQRYKALAQRLGRRSWLGRDVFAGQSLDIGQIEEEITKTDEPQEQAELDLEVFALVRAFADILKRTPKVRADHKVVMERVSVTDRIYEILGALDRIEHVLFADLFADQVERIDLVVTFLAVLEMAKLKLVRIHQPDVYGAIRLQKSVTETETVAAPSVDLALDDYR